MNACTVCSSKYPFLLNDCFFENDQITCFRVEVIKNIFNTTINFILCQIVLVRFFRVNRSSRGFAKNSFFFNITRDPRVYKSEDCGDAGKSSAALSAPA